MAEGQPGVLFTGRPTSSVRSKVKLRGALYGHASGALAVDEMTGGRGLVGSLKDGGQLRVYRNWSCTTFN